MLEELLQVLYKSGQSEAVAIADTVRDSLAGLPADDDPAAHAIAIAEEFRDWGQSLAVAIRNGHF